MVSRTEFRKKYKIPDVTILFIIAGGE